MFKRANKITALLVAAASIMSVVPAMAADTTTRLGNKEGTVKQGIAFGDGTYAYYGYRTDDDETGIWYNKDGESKDSFNDDLEDYRFDNASKYGEKYAYAKESSNDDEYLVDLSTGKAVDDETAEEKLDTAKAKLVTNIKKADRYENLITKTSELDAKIDANQGSFDQILKGQFGEVWYQYSVTSDASATFSYTDLNGTTTSSAAAFTGFTNESGKYIDLSLETNIRVFSTYTGRAEWIKQYGDVDKDSKLKVDLVNVKAVAQDKDFIYTITTVLVTDSNTVTGTPAPKTQYFVQKISKSQGSKDDDEAYTAKSIDSYQLQSANGVIYDEGDFTDAYDHLVNDTDGKLVGITAKDGNLFVVRVDDTDGDKLHIFKLKLGKFKKDTVVGDLLKSDVDTNAVLADDDTDNGDVVEFDTNNTADEDDGIQNFEQVLDRNNGDVAQLAGQDLWRLASVSIDTTGNIWALEKGKIIKYDGLDDKTLYTVDRAMNAIDVYDADNLIVWDTDGDVYTNISEGHKVTVGDGVAVDPTVGQTTPATVGWSQLTDGTWNFYDATGAKVVNNWANVGGVWYFLKADGVMATGWLNQNGTWYFLNASGAMATGWFNDNGTWYFLNASGAMLSNTTVDGYVLGASGAWIK